MRRRLALAATAAVGAALAVAPAASGATVLAEMPPAADARDIGRDNGVTLTRDFREIGWAEYALPPAAPAAARARLLDDRRVFRLDFQRRGEDLEAEVVPDDPFTARPPAFSDGVETDYPWELSRFYTAWDVGRGSLNTRIAVIDDEIEQTHPDLAAKVLAAYNAEAQFPATYGSGDTRASAQQVANGDLHGTHVAGTAAGATNNATGVSGAGFDVGLMPVKVTLTVPAGPSGDALFVANAVDGIVWATNNGADVINMSFGTATPHPALADAVAYAVSRDVLPVAAAGNTEDDPGARGIPLYPAAFEGVLAVGATDWNGAITNFSTNGAYVDAAAPGARILSTWDRRGADNPIDGYFVLSGTSMASPIVAGLAGLVRDVRPDLPAAQVQAIILATASDRGAPGRDPAYGAGLIDADAALRAARGAVPAVPAPVAAPPAAAAPPPTAAPLRRRARLAYRCAVGDTPVRIGAAVPIGVGRGRTLVCRGRTIPGLGRARLQVQRLVRGRWTRIDSLRSSVAGRFGFAVRLRTPGRWTVRAALAPTPAVAPAAGARATLAVFSRR